jgi:membrane protein DedA with SNARE-associated domain
MAHHLTQLIASYGYPALIVLAFLQACCIPISSEATFALSGLAASQGKLNLAAVILLGTLAEMAGSTTAYAIGRRGGRRLLDRYGKWVLISSSDLDRAERFFARRGAWAVAIARALPLVRCFAGFGAGVVEVPAAPFTIFNLIGTTAWVTALTMLGYRLGGTVEHFFRRFTLIGVALAVLFVVALVAHRWHAIRKEGGHRGQADTDAGARSVAPVKAPARGGAHRAGRGPVG